LSPMGYRHSSPAVRCLVVCRWFCPPCSTPRAVAHRLVSWLGPGAVKGLFSINGGLRVRLVVGNRKEKIKLLTFGPRDFVEAPLLGPVSNSYPPCEQLLPVVVGGVVIPYVEPKTKRKRLVVESRKKKKRYLGPKRCLSSFGRPDDIHQGLKRYAPT
jgi:hypothetical protein